MRRSRVILKGVAAAAAMLAAACAPPRGDFKETDAVPSQAATCRMAERDESWLRAALRNWLRAEAELLKLDNRPLPQIVLYDAACTYALAAAAEQPHRWSATAHGAEIILPNGARIGPGPNAFNAEGPFVVFSLPSLWEPVAPQSEIALETRLEGIFFHELAHARQSSISPSFTFTALHARYGLAATVNDDSVQERFAADVNYRSSFEAERDLLYDAAAAASITEARALACRALARLRDRRRRHLGGPDGQWAQVDEVSLTTEGLGEWVGYAWLTRARGVSAAVLLPRMRGSYWSQDEGLGIFLVVDRLAPGWQRLLLAPEPTTAEPLLALACSG